MSRQRQYPTRNQSLKPLLGALGLLLLVLFSPSTPALAQTLLYTPTATTSGTQGPTATLAATPVHVSRSHAQTTEKTTYQWGLFWWADNTLACSIFLDSEDQPTQEQVRLACGGSLLDAWLQTPPCEDAADNKKDCQGLYLDYQGSHTYQVEEVVEYPPPSASVGLVNCPAWGLCEVTPQLAFSGHEPVEGYAITAVHVRIGGKSYQCDSTVCLLEMPLTGDQGAQVEYWAVSSFGDQTPHHTFRMRNQELPTGGYRFELLGAQWADLAPPCALTWEVFPEVDNGGLPWDEQISGPELLATNHAYTFLAGELIWSGQVEAQDCPGNGLLANGAANTCGQEKARVVVGELQNRYDEDIFQAAESRNLPPRVLKGIIGQESQFWPVSDSEDEFGLGMLTMGGVDMLLTWNVPYFVDTCVPLYGEDACAAGYSSLEDTEQAHLRGLALQQVGTEGEIGLLADTLAAACAQTGQLVKNVTGKALADVVSYDDLWPITLGLYHAGAGCMGDAMTKAWTEDQVLTWPYLSEYLAEDCDLARDYVEKVLYYGRVGEIAVNP